MEHIQSIREIVEKLAGDEKMDDGQYLEVMNRLKSLYEREEQKGPVFREGSRLVFASGDAEAVRISEPERRVIRIASFQEPMRLFHHYFVDASRQNFRCDSFAEMMIKFAEAVEDGTIATRTDICKDFVLSINLLKASAWRNPEHREMLLRNQHYTRHRLEFYTKWRWSHTRWRPYTYKPDGQMNELEWGRLFHNWLPFYTKVKVARRGDKWRPREEEELKKLHPVRLFLKIPNHPIELDLYTDKVKLGATEICRPLKALILAIVCYERWTDVPLERLLMECEKNLTLEVSGITARSRGKERRYTGVFGLLEIVYQTKYSK